MSDGTSKRLYEIADELRGSASIGLHHAQNDYDRERYEHALRLSAEIVGVIEGRDGDAVLETYRGNLDHVSPSVGANAVVMRGERVLLIRRSDDGLWALPGGLVEVGETIAEATARELREEAGVDAEAVRLLGVWDSRRVRSKLRMQLYHTAMFMEQGTGELRPDGVETTEVGFFAEDDLPPLSGGHKIMVPALLELARDSTAPPFFDRA